MTAKEKANSIVFNMLKYSSELSNDLYTGNASIYKFRNAKQCALIAVDEIIALNLQYSDIEYGGINSYEFWEQVKTEIENI